MARPESFEERLERQAEEARVARENAAKGKAIAQQGFDMGLRRAQERERKQKEDGDDLRRAAQASECCQSRLLYTDTGPYCTACGRKQ